MNIEAQPEAKTQVSNESLVEYVYSKIRSEILDGTLRPNQPLVEVELAERLNVSRMPVRESLQRLAVDGLVRSQRRRWIVHEHTAREVKEMYEVRAALEGEAAALAAQRATEDEAAAIVQAGIGSKFSDAPDREQRVTANDTFHGLIMSSARNDRLKVMVIRNSFFHFNRHIATLYSTEELRESGRHHEEIARSIREKDSEKARLVSINHIHHALGIILRKIY